MGTCNSPSSLPAVCKEVFLSCPRNDNFIIWIYKIALSHPYKQYIMIMYCLTMDGYYYDNGYYHHNYYYDNVLFNHGWLSAIPLFFVLWTCIVKSCPCILLGGVFFLVSLFAAFQALCGIRWHAQSKYRKSLITRHLPFLLGSLGIKIGARYTWVHVIGQAASLLFARRCLYFAQEIIILLFEFTKLHLAIHG